MNFIEQTMSRRVRKFVATSPEFRGYRATIAAFEKLRRRMDGCDNRILEPLFAINSANAVGSSFVYSLFNKWRARASLFSAAMAALVVRDRPILLGCRSHSETDAAYAWLTYNQIDHLVYLVDQPFFDHVGIDRCGEDYGLKIKRFQMEPYHPSVVEDDEDAASEFMRRAPPVLLLPNGSYVSGFSPHLYALACGDSDVARENIRPELTASMGGVSLLHDALLYDLRANLWADGIGRTILDFGCGHGDGTAWLQEQVGDEAKVVGYDPGFPGDDDWSDMGQANHSVVLAHRVLNTIPSPSERVEAVRKMLSVAPDLVLVVVPRMLHDDSAPTFFRRPFADGTIKLVGLEGPERREQWIFQRTFTEAELDLLFEAASGQSSGNYKFSEDRTEAIIKAMGAVRDGGFDSDALVHINKNIIARVYCRS